MESFYYLNKDSIFYKNICLDFKVNSFMNQVRRKITMNFLELEI
jgi:hypothetical protein